MIFTLGQCQVNRTKIDNFTSMGFNRLRVIIQYHSSEQLLHLRQGNRMLKVYTVHLWYLFFRRAHTMNELAVIT